MHCSSAVANCAAPPIAHNTQMSSSRPLSLLDDWLHKHTYEMSASQRQSIQCILDFLEVTDLEDLYAIDEPALSFACTNKPVPGARGHFSILDISRFRRVLCASNIPTFSQPRTTVQSMSSPAISGVSSSITECTQQAKGDNDTCVPCDPIFSTPIVATHTPPRKWTLVRVVDLTERLNAHLGPTRQHYNGHDYYNNEWPVVIKLLWVHICEDTSFDCFWNWHDPTPVPVKTSWHSSTSAYPREGPAYFGVEYSCDFTTICGCPRKLRVLRSPNTFLFQIHLLNVSVRHGCIHTIARDKCSSTASKGEIPTLHAGLQSFIRRKSFNHDSTSSLTWGDIRDKTAQYILHASFLHCTLPHLTPRNTSARDYRIQCRHPYILRLLRNTHQFPSRQAQLSDPPTTTGRNNNVIYSDHNANVAALVLQDGHTQVGCHTFLPPVDEQCRDFLRKCNARFHDHKDNLGHSSLDVMHENFSLNNLYQHFLGATENRVKLDLFQYNVIGFCYKTESQGPHKAPSLSVPSRLSNTNNRYLHVFGPLCILHNRRVPFYISLHMAATSSTVSMHLSLHY
jgi:hypothetical protein